MYELIKWSGQLVDEISPECESAIVTMNDDNDGNVINVKFCKKLNSADKTDYLFSIFSGLFSEAIDQLIINNKIKKQSKTKEITKTDMFEIASVVLRSYKDAEGNSLNYDKELNNFYNGLSKELKKSGKYKELAKDFSDGLSYKALIISIIESIFDCSIGQDENGKFVIQPLNEEEIIKGELISKIENGVLKWIINETVKYKATGKFDEEIDSLFKLKGGIKRIEVVIEELANSSLFKNKKFDKSKTFKYLAKKINESNVDKRNNMPTDLLLHEIPVFINACLTRTYFFIRCLIKEIKKHNVENIEGLEVLELTDVLIDNKSVLRRIDTISSGTLMLFNIGIATVFAGKEAYKVARDDIIDAQYLNALLKGIPVGVSQIAVRINFKGVVAFTTAFKVDRDYITYDLKNVFKRKDVVLDYKKSNKQISTEEIERLMGLNKVETKLLYSLEYQIIKEDIKNTKESKEQILKKEWLNKWKENITNTIKLNKIFEEDKEKLYKAIKTHANVNDETWLYKIILELITFKPYCELENNNKKYKKLKLANDEYLEKTLCKEQGILKYSEIKSVKKSYKKNKDILSMSNAEKVALLSGAAAVTVGVAGAAFIFAPVIAVGLVGGSMGLSGAALTSASLALVGGGSLAAGGLGMAGGAMIIAGGGAIVGLSASGASATAYILLSNPKFVLEDYSKLLTKCKVILLGKYNMIDEVEQICLQIESDIRDTSIQLEVFKSEKNNSKEHKQLVNNLEDSIKVMERCAKELKRTKK